MLATVLGVCVALLLANLALRAFPLRSGVGDLSSAECAYLRGGTRGRVLAGLAELHLLGVVDASGYQMARRGSDPVEDPVAQALVDALARPATPRALERAGGVRRAVRPVREKLIEDGLLVPAGHWAVARCALVGVPVVGALAVADQPLDPFAVIAASAMAGLAAVLWLAPRRTVAGRRVLRRERRRYERVALAAPVDGEAPDLEAVGMFVALQGEAALDLLARPPQQSQERES